MSATSTIAVPAVAVKAPSFNYLLILIPVALILALIYVLSHHNTKGLTSTSSQPRYVPLAATGGAPVAGIATPSAPSTSTPVQSSLTTAPWAAPSDRGGLSTDPGLVQYTTTVNPDCLPGTQYYPACTFTNPRSADYNPNPQCYKGSKYYPLCLTTSVHTSASWR